MPPKYHSSDHGPQIIHTVLFSLFRYKQHNFHFKCKWFFVFINHLLTLELMLIDSTSTFLSGLWEVEFASLSFLSQYWQFQLYPWLENENQLFLSKNISYWLNTLVCEAFQLQYTGLISQHLTAFICKENEATKVSIARTVNDVVFQCMLPAAFFVF